MQLNKNIISEFYKEYKKKLDKVMELEVEQRAQGSDLMEWIKKYKDRARQIAQLFKDNENAIAEVITPVLTGEIPMNGYLAECFLEEIIAMREDFYGDSLVTYEVLKVIVDFYEREPEEEPDNYMIALGLLAAYEDVLGTEMHLEQSIDCNTKLIGYKDHFTTLKNPYARRRLFLAFYARMVSEMKRKNYSIERIMKYMEEGLFFYRDPDNRKAADYKFDEYIDTAITRCVLAILTFTETDPTCPPEKLLEACEIGIKEYEKYIRRGVEPDDVPVVCNLNYYLAAYRMGRISAAQAFDGLYHRYNKVIAEGIGKKNLHKNPVYFEVLSSYSPEMLCILRAVNYTEEKKKELREKIVMEVMDFFANIPPVRRNDIANAFALDAFRKVLPHYEITLDNLENIMRAVITRESTTAIHTNMVKAISTEIVKTIIDKKPELLVPALGCQTPQEVVERRKTMLNYANLAAFCHDIGKLAVADIINIQYRKITETEFGLIKEHPAIGAEILSHIPYLKPFAEIANGHHKTYDDTRGYPREFSHAACENSIWIDVITISDCIDAATDSVGRVYKQAKTFEEILQELQEKAGRRYNPEVIELLTTTESLQNTIRYIISEGRDSYLYAVYRHMDK